MNDGFSCYPHTIIDAHLSAIGPFAFAVYACLKRHADRNGMAFPSVNHLMGKVGVSKPTIIKAIRTLEEHGLISTVSSAGGRSVYTLQPEGNWSTPLTGTRGEPVNVVNLTGKPDEPLPVNVVNLTGKRGGLEVESVSRTIEVEPISRCRFTPPSLPEIEAYFAVKKSTASEAGRFFDFYESNGWKVGRNKMQKWHNAASGWINRAGVSPNGKTAPKETPYANPDAYPEIRYAK